MSEKMFSVDSLVINITDICNMNCKFCLRGDGDFYGKKMDLSLIPRIFDGIASINSITITGGEPSCYEEAITAITDYIEASDMDVNGFFIVTNAKKYSQVIVDCVKRVLFRYLSRSYGNTKIVEKLENRYQMDNGCTFSIDMEDELYSFGVAVSIDSYHEAIPTVNYLKYRFCGIYSFDKETNGQYGVIARGRGENIADARPVSYREFYAEHDNCYFSAEEVYVTIDGKVFGDCDMSYDMEEDYEPVGDLTKDTLCEIIERMAEEA